MNTSLMYNGFMSIGAIGSFMVLVGFVGAWIIGARIQAESSEQVAELESQVQKKDIQILELENDLVDFMRYSWLARLDMFGSPVATDGTILVQTDLTHALQEFFTNEEDSKSTSFRADDDAISHYHAIAESLPNFPLPHYLLAVSLFKRGDVTWREHGETARRMIEKIVRVPEHHGWYDDAHRALAEMFEAPPNAPMH